MALQDRLKIGKGGGMDIMLGRQTLLNCAGFHGHGDGCNGGDTIDVFKCAALHGGRCMTADGWQRGRGRAGSCVLGPLTTPPPPPPPPPHPTPRRRYMHKFPLPDEGCQPYSGTDHHAFKKKGMKTCPAQRFW